MERELAEGGPSSDRGLDQQSRVGHELESHATSKDRR